MGITPRFSSSSRFERPRRIPSHLGGIGRPKSSSSFDAPGTYTPRTPVAPGNPNPDKWELLRVKETARCVILEIRYPDCTNYEGRKILVFRETTLVELVNQRLIDPHFCQNPNFKSPFARFEPTELGWQLAEQTAMAYQKSVK